MLMRTLLVAIGLALSPAARAADAKPAAASGPISVVVVGSGPDVILIPGLASSRDVWAGLVGTLKATHRLHLVQLAGFAGAPPVAGASSRVAAPAAEAIAAYIRRARLKAPAVIGHSLGGEAALMLGARHPDQVGRLLIVDALPFYSLLFDPAATVAGVTPRATGFRDGMLAASPEQFAASQTAAIAGLVKTEAARPKLIAEGGASDRATVANATYELMTTDLRPELKAITAPVEVVYAYDPVYGVPAATIDATFRAAYAATPIVSFTRIEGSFHFAMIDQPEAFTRAVVAFIGR